VDGSPENLNIKKGILYSFEESLSGGFWRPSMHVRYEASQGDSVRNVREAAVDSAAIRLK